LTGAPEVSVVVASVRPTRLAFLLEALERQTLDRARYEVVVERDHAERPAGPAVLRNRGVGVAQAPLLAFTDDDCRPASDWLERLVERAAHADGDFILQGRTEPDPDERQRLYGLARSQSIVGPSPWFEACNILYPRELFERLGGFDERFDGGGEDADLGLRAVAAGARPVYVDEARVWHAVHSRHVWQAVREEGRWHTIPLVLASHPRQREALELGIFWKAGHPRVLLAAAGLVAAARGRGIGLAATLPYMHQHVRSYSKTPRGMLRAALDAPARALVDLAGVAVTVRSAIRHRAAII
jgi:hypothetical protein